MQRADCNLLTDSVPEGTSSRQITYNSPVDRVAGRTLHVVDMTVLMVIISQPVSHSPQRYVQCQIILSTRGIHLDLWQATSGYAAHLWPCRYLKSRSNIVKLFLSQYTRCAVWRVLCSLLFCGGCSISCLRYGSDGVDCSTGMDAGWTTSFWRAIPMFITAA